MDEDWGAAPRTEAIKVRLTSAIWNVIERPWRTIFAPIFTSRSRNVVVDQWLTSLGDVSVRRTLARLWARA